MSSRSLSSEMVSLIHHVELNESGWWKKAIGQVIKGTLWRAGIALTFEELIVQMKRELSVAVAEELIRDQIGKLAEQGAVSIIGQKYKLAEFVRSELNEISILAEKEHQECHDIFVKACELHVSDLCADQVYAEFSRCLLKSVRVAGANLFHLLADGMLERDVDWLVPFLAKYGEQHQEGLKVVVTSFFAPGNSSCRKQVLRLLTAHFFAEASQLSVATLMAIESKRKKRSIKIVLDTNFLFSILQLHENPGDESALSLVEIAKQSDNNFNIVLYVLPSTVEEAQNVIVSQIRQLQNIRTSQAMSRAVSTQQITSIAKKFFDAAGKSPGLTAEAYFAPYIEDMRTVLAGKNIKILDAHPSLYRVRQDVLDDVVDETKKQEAELPVAKHKSYETLLHDAILWHAVKDRRSVNDNSLFEVEYWAVSIDWKLIAFDRQKRISNQTSLPVVLHPSNLIQFIQFWIPRSQDLDDVLVDSLKLPLYFQSFDPEDERATMKILDSISRFEDVADFSESTIKVLLTNKALRKRLKSEGASNEESFDLVRSELESINDLAASKLVASSAALRAAELQLESERESRRILEDEALRVARLNTAAQAVADSDRSKLARIDYFLKFIVAPTLSACFVFYIAHKLLGFLEVPAVLVTIACVGFSILPITIFSLYGVRYASSRPCLAAWEVVKFQMSLSKCIYGLLFFAVSSILSAVLWEVFKPAYDWLVNWLIG